MKLIIGFLCASLALPVCASAESLASLIDNGHSISNGTLTYSNFTATLTLPPPTLRTEPNWWRTLPMPLAENPYFYSTQPTLETIDISATPIGLQKNLSLIGFSDRTIDFTLRLTYNVAGEIHGMGTMPPQTPIFNSNHALTATTLEGTTYNINNNPPSGVPGTATFLTGGLSVRETVYLIPNQGSCTGPPSQNNISRCSLFVNDAAFTATYFTAVPEPSSIILLATGLAVATWRYRQGRWTNDTTTRCSLKGVDNV